MWNATEGRGYNQLTFLPTSVRLTTTGNHPGQRWQAVEGRDDECTRGAHEDREDPVTIVPKSLWTLGKRNDERSG